MNISNRLADINSLLDEVEAKSGDDRAIQVYENLASKFTVYDEVKEIRNKRYLLKENGVFSVIIPKEYEQYFCQITDLHKLYCNRVCYVNGSESSEVKRVMMEFSFIKCIKLVEYLTIERSRHNYTDKYIRLCKSFYLNM